MGELLVSIFIGFWLIGTGVISYFGLKKEFQKEKEGRDG